MLAAAQDFQVDAAHGHPREPRHRDRVRDLGSARRDRGDLHPRPARHGRADDGLHPRAQGLHRERDRRPRLAHAAQSSAASCSPRSRSGSTRRCRTTRSASATRSRSRSSIAILYFRPEGLLGRPAEAQMKRRSAAGRLRGTALFAVPLALDRRARQRARQPRRPARDRQLHDRARARARDPVVLRQLGHRQLRPRRLHGRRRLRGGAADDPAGDQESILARRCPASSPTTPSSVRARRPARSGRVGALVAAVIGLALTRMQESAMAMATIGVLVIFFVVFDNWDEASRAAPPACSASRGRRRSGRRSASPC